MTHTPHKSPARRRPALTVAALTAVAGLALTACSGTEDPAPATVTPTQTTTATASADPADPVDSTATVTPSDTARTTTPPPSASPTRDGTGILGRPDTKIKQVNAEGEYDLAPVAVRVGAHDGFDRVVIELKGAGKPGWFVEYTEDPRQQASGYPIEFEGQGALNVAVIGVSYPFEHPVPEDEWVKTGPVAGAAGNITGVSHEGIFEGHAQFTVGLAEGEAPYSVTLLEEPTRVVIDIENDS